MADQVTPLRVLMVEGRAEERERLVAELTAQHLNLEFRFSPNGHQALAEMEFHGGIDVVITAADAPLADGLSLLSDARRRCPQVVRVLLVSPHGPSVARNGLQMAHMVLPAPLHIASLATFLERHSSVRNRMDNAAVERLVGSVDLLPSPTTSVVALNEVLNQPDVSLDAITAILELDVAATAKLLSLVNSAYFGLSHRITSVRHAVTFLGLETTRNLLGAVELVRAYSSPCDEVAAHVSNLHAHSIAVAELARSFASHTHYMNNAFAAGLMHDIGALMVASYAPAKFLDLCDDPANEVALLGTTHNAIGAYLLSTWGLPWSLVDAVSQSHDADKSAELVPNAAHAVFVAEQVVGLAGEQSVSWECPRVPNHDYLASLGMQYAVANLLGGAAR